MLAANYGIKFVEVLRDTSKLPLFVGITTTINESFLYGDLIVPDTTYLETVQTAYSSSTLQAGDWLGQRAGEAP